MRLLSLGLAIFLLAVSGTAIEARDVHPGTGVVRGDAPAKVETKVEAKVKAGTSSAVKLAATSLPAKEASTTASVAAEPKAKPAPPRVTLRATIDLTRQRMTVTSNGRRLYTWPVSSGKIGHETPGGTFKPSWMARQWYSRKYDMAPMPYSVFFNQGIATHGTTAVSRLGRPASHGCIRLHTSNARRFYNLVRRHGKAATRITVKGRARHGRRYAKRRSGYASRRYNRVDRVRPIPRRYRANFRRSIYQGYR